MAEETMNITGQEVQPSVSVKIALTKKSGGKKILVDTLEGYETGYSVDGIAIIDGENGIIVCKDEYAFPYGGLSVDDDSEKAHKEEPLSIMTEYDGKSRTEYIISRYGYGDGTAAFEAMKYGWLPSGGEMALLKANADTVNGKMALVGGTLVGQDAYWTSQLFNNDYVWSLDMAEGMFGRWRGQVDVLKVRPVKSIEGYSEI